MNWGAKQTDYFSSNFFDGMELVYPDRWKKLIGEKNSAALIKRNPCFDRVPIIISGGAGSGPLFPGYVGEGLADAVVTGGPFSAPNAYCLYEAGRYLGKEKGVFFLYNNFAGDFLNNDMAQELLAMDGIASQSLAATDDIASAMGEDRSKRSGRCGVALLIKIAARCAALGMTLDEIAQTVSKANQRLGTLSVMVDFDKHEIIYGNGFSGEPGIRTETHMDLNQTAADAMEMLVKDLKPQPDEELVLLVNRLRYTCYSDGFLMAKAAHAYLSRGYPNIRLRVANYSNIMDIYGFNFSILCADRQLTPYLEGMVSSDSFLL